MRANTASLLCSAVHLSAFYAGSLTTIAYHEDVIGLLLFRCILLFMTSLVILSTGSSAIALLRPLGQTMNIMVPPSTRPIFVPGPTKLHL